MRRCPYLGLHDDRATALAYPSIWNYCYRPKQPGSIILSHQSAVCLGTDFLACPVYGVGQTAALPLSLKGSTTGYKRNASLSRKIVRAILFFLILVAISAAVIARRNIALQMVPVKPQSSFTESNFNLPMNELTSDLVSTNASVRTRATSAIERLSMTLTPAFVQSLTAAPADICGLVLDVPFGKAVKFVLHRVASGENLTKYAKQYHTTVNAILKLNYHLPTPVWENWIVVIPLDFEEVSELPPFETYHTVGVELSLDELASQLNTDPAALHEYNAFGEDCRTYSGWLLIPREVSTPIP